MTITFYFTCSYGCGWKITWTKDNGNAWPGGTRCPDCNAKIKPTAPPASASEEKAAPLYRWHFPDF